MNPDQLRVIEIALNVIFNGTEHFKNGLRREDYHRLTEAVGAMDIPTAAITAIRDAIARSGFFSSPDGSTNTGSVGHKTQGCG
jgi:hypothetical protein